MFYYLQYTFKTCGKAAMCMSRKIKCDAEEEDRRIRETVFRKVVRVYVRDGIEWSV